MLSIPALNASGSGASSVPVNVFAKSDSSSGAIPNPTTAPTIAKAAIPLFTFLLVSPSPNLLVQALFAFSTKPLPVSVSRKPLIPAEITFEDKKPTGLAANITALKPAFFILGNSLPITCKDAAILI